MNNEPVAITPTNGPQPVGPYSPALISGDYIFVSGQVGKHPTTGDIEPTIEAQTHQTLKNVRLLLQAAGCDLKDVVKTTAFITKAEFFEGFNTVYRDYFHEPYPARSTVICSLVSTKLLVEIEVIAKRPA